MRSFVLDPSVRTGEGAYCYCLRAVTPECGARTRASGLCFLAKEEKPESRARRAPAHMKRLRE
jgi:hypothetical protein